MRVCFRIEGNHAIGMGHVMRCLTLARALQAQGQQVMFICSQQTARAVRAHFPRSQCHIVVQGLSEAQDAARCAAVLMRHPADWMVVDHYGLGAAWERVMLAHAKVMAIDDLARKHEAQLVLDTALDGEARYRGKLAQCTKGLFGPGFALLRDSVARARAAYATKSDGRLFVCFGGSDPQDMTRHVARILAGKCSEVDFVVGYAYQGRDALLALCQRQKGWKVHVDHPAPEALMARSALAVGAGGTMTWERCAVGLPSIVISIAENQKQMSEALGKRGVISYLGAAEDLDDCALVTAVQGLMQDAGERAYLSASGRRLVPVHGARRVVRAMGAL